LPLQLVLPFELVGQQDDPVLWADFRRPGLAL
jgi:hypothetical protein